MKTPLSDLRSDRKTIPCSFMMFRTVSTLPVLTVLSSKLSEKVKTVDFREVRKRRESVNPVSGEERSNTLKTLS